MTIAIRFGAPPADLMTPSARLLRGRLGGTEVIVLDTPVWIRWVDGSKRLSRFDEGQLDLSISCKASEVDHPDRLGMTNFLQHRRRTPCCATDLSPDPK